MLPTVQIKCKIEKWLRRRDFPRLYFRWYLLSWNLEFLCHISFNLQIRSEGGGAQSCLQDWCKGSENCNLLINGEIFKTRSDDSESVSFYFFRLPLSWIVLINSANRCLAACLIVLAIFLFTIRIILFAFSLSIWSVVKEGGRYSNVFRN